MLSFESTLEVKKKTSGETRYLFKEKDKIIYNDTISELVILLKNLYNIILEKLEVNANDKWLPVKQTGREVYFPNGIENDFEVINDLLNYALDYFKEVFIKSSVSKKEQE